MKYKCLVFSKFPWASQMIVENRFHGHFHRHGERFRDIAPNYVRVGRIVCAMLCYTNSYQGEDYWERIESATIDNHV
jgi:hypothetical protein